MSRTNNSRRKLPISKLKLAVVADPLCRYGEYEKQLGIILKAFPNSDLFVPYYDQKFVNRYFSNIEIHQSFIKSLPFRKRIGYFYTLLYPKVYNSFNFSDFDAVLSFSKGLAKLVNVPQNKKHINLSFFYPKWLWEKDYSELLGVDGFSSTKGVLYRLFILLLDLGIEKKLRRKDAIAAKDAEMVITNSQFLRKKINKLYKVNAEVIYPPINIDKLQSGETLNRRENWFLHFAQYSEFKNIKLVIKACADARVPLKIVGQVEKEEKVHKIINKLNAKGYVKFLGNLSKKGELDLIKRSRAVIYVSKSDSFPTLLIKANALGTPVIAYSHGIVSEIVSQENPQTGILFQDFNLNALSRILKNFNEGNFNSKNCMSYAQGFDSSIFTYKLKTYIEDVIQNN